MRVKLSIFLVIVAVSLFASSSASGQSTIVILNDIDAPGVGFNDNTPVAPVGGNNGTTLGEQRMNAAQFAANIWGATLNSGPTITIRASWEALGCTENTGSLAAAGTISVAQNFPNAPFTNTWFNGALANALSGSDPSGPEIRARFNISLGSPGCLTNSHWYLGFDGNEGFNGIDAVSVFLHEFAHGLGFSNITNTQTGVFFNNTPSVWDRFLRDNTSGKLWVDMTTAERAASATNTNNLVWSGPLVTAAVPSVLVNGADEANRVRMYAPSPFEPGSSVSHFDRSASPSLLMEPNITSGLNHTVAPPSDLTFLLLRDIGWNTASPAPSPPPPPPANDNFAAAQAISGCSGTVAGTNVSATKESGEPDHASNGGTRTVWYQWQAPSSGSVTITTAGSSYDTVLGVYTGSAVNSLTTIGQNDDVVSGDTSSRVIFNATAGVVYRIAVGGFNNQSSGGDFGQFLLNWTASNCVVAPTIQLLLDQSGPAVDQASAFDSMLLLRDPFPVINSANVINNTADPNTRVVVFVRNLPNVPASSVVVNLIDSNNIAHDVTAQDVRVVPGQDFTQVTFRLPGNLQVGTCRIKVVSQGLFSNTATIRIRI